MPLTPATRMRTALDTLNWSQRGFAALLGVERSHVARWCSGRYEPPQDILAWLEGLAAFHAANPPPPTTQRPPRLSGGA